MSSRIWITLPLAGALNALAACGGSKTDTQLPTEGGDTASSDAEREGSKGGPSVEGETGALNENQVKAIFNKTALKARSCFVNGTKRVAYLGGNVHFRVVVDEAGAIKAAYMKESTLGDRETEACILGALKAASWPKPEGGKEGYAESELQFEPSDDERAPTDLAPEQLGDGLNEAKNAVSKCKNDAGTGAVKVTLYVETDGKAKAVGVSFADEKGEAAASCVVSAIQAVKFPSPGSYAGKASIVFD